ncbi:diphthine--ammonia ligase family protein, partial [Aspergillus lucknowensis]
MPPLKSRPNRNPNPSPGLNVIALISGGKDSLYSILHCIRNGHRVVALANLHPPLSNTTTTGIGTSTIHNDPSRGSGRSSHGGEKPKGEDEEVPGEVEERSGADDIDSFMYQTIGWGVIPLYEAALGIPLYRAPIAGGAVDKGRVYRDRPDPGSDSDSDPGPSACSAQKATGHEEEEEDETESLIPLLRRIMQAHPEANAVCAGAILSTYQRTRIEDVAARLGLTPLAWLWMYPFLPAPVERMSASPSASRPGDGGEAGLLEDMAAVGCSARIVKVASGGLDEGFLWGDVAGS